MFHKVTEIVPAENFTLKALFENGEQRLYSVAPLFEKWPSFCSLAKIPGLFEQVKVDVGGYGISWNDELDLSSEELWYNGSLSA